MVSAPTSTAAKQDAQVERGLGVGMSWIKVLEVVRDEIGEIEFVLLDVHYNALGKFIAAVSGRMGSIG